MIVTEVAATPSTSRSEAWSVARRTTSLKSTVISVIGPRMRLPSCGSIEADREGGQLARGPTDRQDVLAHGRPGRGARGRDLDVIDAARPPDRYGQQRVAAVAAVVVLGDEVPRRVVEADHRVEHVDELAGAGGRQPRLDPDDLACHGRDPIDVRVADAADVVTAQGGDERGERQGAEELPIARVDIHRAERAPR